MRAGIAVSVAVAAALVFAAPPGVEASTATPSASQRAPEIGQVSKDSVWVPTPERMIRRLLQLADVTSEDTVLDLGSGDGRIPIHAAKHFGARAVGVELEENLIRLSNASARTQGVADRVRFVRQDLFQFDLTQATVIALYISPGVMTRLKPRLLSLKPGTRVVSHQFTLDDWEPDESVRTEGRSGYLWVVPADVAGTWRVDADGDGFVLHVEQSHQALTVRGERAGRPVPVLAARLRGTEIRFSSFDADGTSRHFSGRVSATGIEGESEREGARASWRATRLPPK
jgi:SAM-dependent methyltransferase